MATKKQGKTRDLIDVEVGPKDLARALQGISLWALAVRRTVLKLDPKTKIKIKAPRPLNGGVGIDSGCERVGDLLD